MPEETHADERRISAQQTDVEYRSIDPQTVYDGMKAVGDLTLGLGTLALGAAAAKQVFSGSGDDSQPQSAPTQQTEPSND